MKYDFEIEDTDFLTELIDELSRRYDYYDENQDSIVWRDIYKNVIIAVDHLHAAIARASIHEEDTEILDKIKNYVYENEEETSTEEYICPECQNKNKDKMN